jgi:hypothetical protein
MCAGSGSLGFPKPSTRETGVPGNMGGRVRRGGVWTLASILGYGARTSGMHVHTYSMCAGSGSLRFPKPSTRETGGPGNMGGRVRRGGAWTLASMLRYGPPTAVCMYIHIPCAPVRALWVSPSRAQGKQGCRGTWEDGLGGGSMDAGQHPGLWRSCCGMYVHTYSMCADSGSLGFPKPSTRGNRGAEEHGRTRSDGGGQGCWPASCAMAHLQRYACTYIFHVRRFGLSPFP